MKNIFASLVLTMSLISCASNPNVVHDIDTQIEVKGNVGEAKLGLNKNREVILQVERQAQDELLIQEAVNMRLHDEMGHYEGELEECLRFQADRRIGGNGVVPEMPDTSALKTEDDYTEDFGTVKDGSLQIVKKTFFRDRLKNARSYDKSLRAMTKLLKKQNEQCQMNLEVARTKAGLSGKKVMAEGYFNDKGNWVQTRRGETSVSDAFELQADNTQRAGH